MELHRAANEAVDELRVLARGVYPARLTELGLGRALHAAARAAPAHIAIDDQSSGEVDEATQVALYFVCMEAIQNATKHGGPGTSIDITLADDDGQLMVVVADDGPGFVVDDEMDSHGLLNMADRVGALGGEFAIDSAPGAGTTIVARVPVGQLEQATSS